MCISIIILSLVCANTFGITPVEFAKAKEKAEKGDAVAQFNLGCSYYIGDGVSKDSVEAIKWYKTSAEQGCPEGQSALGYCYFEGKGVIKDEAEAVKWFRKAAEQGDAIAQYNLGGCYLKGFGVLKDSVEAYAYYNLAGITLESARKNRDLLEKEMTPSQREAGLKRSKELLALIEAKKKAESK